MRRLLSLTLILVGVFAASVALAEGVPGVEIIDDDRAKITGAGMFYLCGDAAVYNRLQNLPAVDDPAEIADAVDEMAAADGLEKENPQAASAYAEAALAVLNGLMGGLPHDEAEASARYVLAERMGGSSDASIHAFAAYAVAYSEEVASAMAALMGAFPSAEAYTAEAMLRADVPAAAYRRAFDTVYEGLRQSYLNSAVSLESAVEMARVIAVPAAEKAAASFAQYVRGDAVFNARLDAYAASVSGRTFILGVDGEGRPDGVLVANIGRVFVRGDATVVLAGVSLQSVEAYDMSTIIMLGGSAQKITTGHAANLYTEGVRIGRTFALNGSTQAHTGSEVGAAFADPDASIHGYDKVQSGFYPIGPAGR